MDPTSFEIMRVIKSPPSAVYIDKKGAIRVGDAAKERIVSEPNDVPPIQVVDGN
jgi:molecular chaperone DnaK (HSP70)